LAASKKEYDLVIVGAGMAGCILAARVAQNGVNPKTGEKLRIALIEAGPYLERTRNSGYGDPRWRKQVVQMQWEEFSHVPHWPWPYGLKAVGGCSLHWGAFAFLPFDVDHKNWVDEMGIDWSKENMQSAVDDVIRNFHVHEDIEEAYAPCNKIFREAGRALGFQPKPYMVARHNCIYCGYIGGAHACKYDSKASSVWYLPAFFENGGELIPDAEVMQVLIDKRGAGGLARGVTYKRDGDLHEAVADKVVVCCGTWGTPVLLARSGYGPRSILGAKAVVDNPNIGQNLDGDTTYDIPVMFDADVKEAGRGTNGGIYWFLDDPKFTDSSGRIRIAEDLTRIVYPHAAAASEFAPPFGKPHMDFMRTANKRLGWMTVGVTKPPVSIKGSVDLETGAHIYPGADYIDKRMKEGWDVAIEVAKKMNVKYSKKFPATFKNSGGMHSNGTCRAGSSPKNSVINQDFESHEVSGLFIADASSYPRAVSCNSGLATATIGVYASQKLVRNHFKRG
jgi:choline dehydrogenase-like flavoprotein